MTLGHFNPVTLEVYWNRLISLVEEAENVLIRTAFSTIIGEARDFACILLNQRGESLAQARMAVPEFALTLPRTVRYFLGIFPPASLKPGDVLITNDPWQGSGHLSDVNLVTPVFYRERLVGFFASVAHVSDFGGTVGYHTGRDVYEEGLYVPGYKLYEAGKRNRLLFDLIAANVRVPKLVLGDIEAMITAIEVGRDRVCEFLDDTGLPDLDDFSEEIGRLAEEAMATALREVPEGVYRGSYTFDGYVEPLTIRAEVTIADGRAYVDFVGTSPQQERGAINAPLSITTADTLYFFQYLFTPDLPVCSALFRPIEVSAPEGCLINPRRPAAVKGRTKTTFHVAEALFNALSSVAPERVQAGSGHSCYVISNGLDRVGRPFNSFYLPAGGMGATLERDGHDCTHFPTNVAVTSIEIFEHTAPLLVLHKEILPDSGGAGRYRGGNGQRVLLRSVSDASLTVTLRPEDWRCPPAGLLGGKPGALCRVFLNGERVYADLIDLKPQDELVVETPGGGGMGPPATRDRGAILRDVREGMVSPERVANVYGVEALEDMLR